MLGNKTRTKFVNSLNFRNAFKGNKEVEHNQELYSNNLKKSKRRKEQDRLNLPLNIR